MKGTLIIVLVALASVAFADVYMHNPRGSNDRNCERNDNRNNGNRLFDSQNNDKGGYACERAVGGPEVNKTNMYYYVGSKLTVVWSNQHGCGANEKLKNCNLVLQYMCNDAEFGNPGLRDGTPSDWNDAATNQMPAGQTNNTNYGYHETYDYYLECSSRSRNKGLWTADQNVGSSASSTRQNPNANSHGWECAEERDYYPYWQPSPWKDIAIFTDDTSRCSMYKSESRNVKEKYSCQSTVAGEYSPYDLQEVCVANGQNWVSQPSFGLAAPECLSTPWTRDNHLGNTQGGFMPSYNWTIPNQPNTNCVLRLRYNISSSEVLWTFDSTMNSGTPNGSPVTQDPYIDVGYGWNVSLAVNTNQYGRTFQDRSYTFEIRSRTEGKISAGATIHNLNVRGKRGNIVETFPAVEYDFVPNYLHVVEGDFVHFQWTGSDYNPNNTPNNAEGGPTDPAQPGNFRADRSNIVPTQRHHDVPVAFKESDAFTSDQADLISLAYINQNLDNCLSWTELLARNNEDADEADLDDNNCMKLNNATGPYYDGGVIKMKKTGTFLYQSTRNTNFSNRAQRGVIYVNPAGLSGGAVAGAVVGTVGVTAAAAGGLFYYAKRNPGSKVADVLSRFGRH